MDAQRPRLAPAGVEGGSTRNGGGSALVGAHDIFSPQAVALNGCHGEDNAKRERSAATQPAWLAKSVQDVVGAGTIVELGSRVDGIASVDVTNGTDGSQKVHEEAKDHGGDTDQGGRYRATDEVHDVAVAEWEDRSKFTAFSMRDVADEGCVNEEGDFSRYETVDDAFQQESKAKEGDLSWIRRLPQDQQDAIAKLNAEHAAGDGEEHDGHDHDTDSERGEHGITKGENETENIAAATQWLQRLYNILKANESPSDAMVRFKKRGPLHSSTMSCKRRTRSLAMACSTFMIVPRKE